MFFLDSFGLLAITGSSRSVPSINSEQRYYTKDKTSFFPFLSTYELCNGIPMNDCPEGTEGNCQQDAAGDWYYTCEPLEQDCSDDPSYSLDCSSWCDDGYVYDYKSGSCCPSRAPYDGGTGWCFSLLYGRVNGDVMTPCPSADDCPRLPSDNYYTKHSECFNCPSTYNPCGNFEGKEKCEDYSYNRCTETSKFIFEYVPQGITVGVCDVECAEENDCSQDVEMGVVCFQGDVMHKTKMFDCLGVECVMSYGYDLVEKCLTKCENAQCIDESCTNIECPDKCENSIWYHDGECEGGECIYTKDVCQYGCEEEPSSILAVIVGEGMCREDSCTGITCEDYCSCGEDSSLHYDRRCVNGKCSDGKTEKYAEECWEECGYEPWYYAWIAVGIVVMVIIISVVIYLIKRRRK